MSGQKSCDVLVVGGAAGLAVRAGTSPDRLAAGDVQQAVEAEGIVLHI